MKIIEIGSEDIRTKSIEQIKEDIKKKLKNAKEDKIWGGLKKVKQNASKNIRIGRIWEGRS